MEEIAATHEPIELWSNFRKHFFEHLREMSDEQRGRFWCVSPQERTKGYSGILKQIGMERMGYAFDREQLSIDARFYESVGGVIVPIVLVEYENVCQTSCHEVEKLLSTSVPLRVLITLAQWSENSYPNKTWRAGCMKAWGQVIKSFAGHLQSFGMPLGGVLGFLVGECDLNGILRYYYFHCDLSRLQPDDLFSNEVEEEIGLASKPKPTSVD